MGGAAGLTIFSGITGGLLQGWGSGFGPFRAKAHTATPIRPTPPTAKLAANKTEFPPSSSKPELESWGAGLGADDVVVLIVPPEPPPPPDGGGVEGGGVEGGGAVEGGGMM